MTNNIEQEFFEAFGIEPELNCKNCLKFNDGESIYGAKGGCYDGSKETKKCYSLYPSITPEIVLGLIKIVIKQYRDFCIRDYLGAEYKAMCDNNWEDWEKEGKDCKTEEEAILSLCIQIKDEIQEQVKELFNDK